MHATKSKDVLTASSIEQEVLVLVCRNVKLLGQRPGVALGRASD